MVRVSKRQEHLNSLEERKYSVSEALEFLNSGPKTRFEESIDVAINLGIDTSKSDQTLRSATSLPSGTGKTSKVAVFAEAEQAKEAIDAGADEVGMEDLSEKIKKGNDDFDVIIATPDTMKIVSPLGKILGPKGTMPNPKTGTVTKDIGKAVKSAKSGQIRYRADKSGIVHGRVGSLSYSSDQIQQNLETLLTDIKRNKPASSKGIFIKKVSLSSTMGAGIELDMNLLNF